MQHIPFDIVELDGRDLHAVPLIERKRILHATIKTCGRILCPEHVDTRGVAFYREVCERDLEGVIAKWKHGAYVCGEEQPLDRGLRRHSPNPNAASRLTWIKVKNPAYSQVEGRGTLFEQRLAVKDS